MSQVPNPFNNTADSLRNVIAAASEIIGGQPVVPDEYGTHMDAAAKEIADLSAQPHISQDINKIVSKHFNAATKGNPESTNLQKSFEDEINRRVHQMNTAKRWEQH